MKIYDITVPIHNDLPVWPGDPRPKIKRLMDMEAGDDANVSSMEIGLHTATHVDAPFHFIKDGKTVDELDLSVCIGPCEVVDLPDVSEISAKDVKALNIPEDCERLLFKTRNSNLWNDPKHAFVEDFVAFTPDGAQAIVDLGIKLVGIDYLSVQKFRDSEPTTHEILLGAGLIALEGIDLREVEAGSYTLYCLPLKVFGADGALARAILTRN